MKLTTFLSAIPALVLFTTMLPKASATEVIILDWNHSWDYINPMGLDPAIADPDFNTTWYLKAADFSSYNGLTFGGDTTAGNPADTSTYDHGSGPGPLGYPAGSMDYFAVAGAEMTAFGTTLTFPNNLNRYTVYFRTTFTTTQTYTALKVRGLIDDSALIYLDGVLVARVNRGTNTEAYNTVGADGTATLNETGTSANTEASIQAINLGIGGNATQADAFVISPVASLAAGGHTLAVSVQQAANTSSDSGFGLQLKGDDAGISAAVANVQRHDNGAGFADDTFSFDVTMTANNLPGAFTWNSDNPAANGPVTGAYGAAVYTYTYPAQLSAGALGTATIKFSDALNAALTATVAVTSPASPGAQLVLSAATPSVGTGFEEATPGLGNFSRQTFNSELGFTSNGKVVPDATGTRNLLFNGVNALMTTEAVKLDPAVKGIKAGVTVRAFTNSATGFEGDDSLRVSVEGSTDGTTWTDIGSVIPTLYGNDANVPNPAGIDQLLNRLGPGVTGEPEPLSHRGWAAKGYPTGTAPAQFSDTLMVPSFTVPDAQPVQLEFTHRYSFELDPNGTRFDGGNVQISINGNAAVSVPGTAFTQNGYDGVITGVNLLAGIEGFNGISLNYGTGGFITSILTLPGVTSQDSVQIQFVGGWDNNQAEGNPNWQITGITVKSGNNTVYSENFSGGDGGLVPTAGWLFDDGTLHTAPVYHNFSRSAIPVPPDTQYIRMKLSEPKNVVLSTSEFFLIDDVKLEVGLDPQADADGDGVSNGLEDIAGTNPADPLSAFKVTADIAAVPANPGTERGTLTFPAADFRVWKLQNSDDLTTWADLDVRYGDPATPSLSLFGDATTPKKFWRISIGY